MNISRKQLYALGEPFGESATRLKPGGRVYGGGGPTTPDKTTTVTDLPDWAKGYAKDTLAKTSALTDISQNPYQTYGGERIAGFQPMQQQAFESAAGLQPSAQLGLGTGLAGAAGLGALGTNYQGRNFQGGQFDTQAAQQYMNPYTQNVVDYQKSQALRDYQIAQPMRQAQAVKQGAFGGSRSAIVDAEAQRSLNSQLQGIEATGQQAAFQNAQQQFNADQARRLQAQQMGEQSRQYGAGLGMQGLQTALQSAGQLGQLGQTQYGQETGIIGLQNQLGTQQQQQAQRPLDMAYQDFINQQNYPYKQLGFMSDMIRGLPLGQQSTSSVYQGSGPGMVQTLAGLGGAAYGFGKSGLFAEGGEVKTYAGDRGSVTSQDNKDSIVEDMYSIAGLQKAKEAALNRRDMDTVAAIDERIAQLNAIQAQSASLNYGLGSAFDQIPPEQQEQMLAGGGIVAFKAGGDTYGNRFEQSLSALQDMAKNQPEVQTAEQYEQGVTSRQPMVERLMGEDVTKPYLEETKTKRAGLADQMEKDKGLAIAMASLKLLSPSKNVRGRSQKDQLLSGLGEAGEAFVGEVGRLKKDYREVDDKLRQSEILLATAQQARKEGNAKLAMGLEDKAQAQKQDAYKTQVGIQEKVAQLNSGLAQTEMQGKTQKEIAAMNAAVHREVANKPGPLKDMVQDYEKRLGRKLTADEMVEVTQKMGAAMYGAKYSGQDKSFERSVEVQKRLEKHPRVAAIALEFMKPNLSAEQKQQLTNEYNQIADGIEQELKQRAADIKGSSASPASSTGMTDTQKQAAAAANRNKLNVIVPSVGTVQDGYRFKGGDPSNPANWERV